MLVSVPAAGGHYLTDMIGGAFVALLAMWLAPRLLPAAPCTRAGRTA